MNKELTRILGVDPGKKRIGLAIGDDRLKIATAFKTIEYEGNRKFLDSIGTIIKEEGIKFIVMGLPKNMNGSEGESAEFSRKLAELIIRELDLKVEFVDERLTTEEAIKRIHQAGKKVGKSKENIDMLAATLILQSYLDKA